MNYHIKIDEMSLDKSQNCTWERELRTSRKLMDGLKGVTL